MHHFLVFSIHPGMQKAQRREFRQREAVRLRQIE